MTLAIESVRLHDFRNVSSLEITPGEGVTVVVGPNGAGKTNLIEAIELVTAATSFRRPPWADLVRWGSAECLVEMKASGEGRTRDVVLRATSEGKRSYNVNGAERTKAADVMGVMPAVIFTPDDLRICKGSADWRRRALDELGQQLSAAYRDMARQYERALKQRNTVLKHGSADTDVLDAWTERVAEIGAALALHRLRLFSRIQAPLSTEYEAVSGGQKLDAAYRSSWWEEADPPTTREEAQKALLERFSLRKEAETARGVTLVGPHRDDVVFNIDGRDARAFGSQGQQRTVALAWKLAEVTVVEQVAGREPVLLLDDVMSELDEARRSALATLACCKAQTFITTTNLGYFASEILEQAEVIELGA